MRAIWSGAPGALLAVVVKIKPQERKIVLLAFLCNFTLLGSYYVLRPLRDTMATVFGADQLQNLFTGTFVFTLICAPIYATIASRVKLNRFLPGLFWFWFANIVLFYLLFQLAPHSRWIAASYFWWFSVVNLFLISVFWTLMADVFSSEQATRLFAFIAAGGSTGAIAGPIITTSLVGRVGVAGLLLIAAAGFLIVIGFVYLLMREKEKLRVVDSQTQQTTLDHALPGNPLRGFRLLLQSPYFLGQAAFMLLMTWVATTLYLLQTDLIAKAYVTLDSRTIAFADNDLVVNIAAAIVLIFGLSRFIQRLGVTAGLVFSPVILFAACLGIVVAPTLFIVQAARAAQRVTQYAIARPSREILFTVVDQDSKYKAKNVIDTVVYRFGDVSGAWIQTGLQALSFGMAGAAALGVAISAAWGIVAAALGLHFEQLRKARAVNCGVDKDMPATTGI